MTIELSNVIEGAGNSSILYMSGPPVNGTDEVQRITVNNSPTGGTFRAIYEGFVSGTIAYNAAAATVQTTLRAMPPFIGSSVSVTGSAGGPWDVTFIGNLTRKDVSTFTFDYTALTGGSTPTVTGSVVTAGVTASFRGQAIGVAVIDTVTGIEYVNQGTALAPNWVPTGTGAPLRVYNGTGGSLAAGTLVYPSGYDATTSLPKIVKADADVAGSPAEYILRDAIADATAGVAYKTATIGSLNTSGATLQGDPVYLSTTAGGWTITAPTAANARVEVVGSVAVKDASAGSIRFDLGITKLVGTNEIQDKAVTGPKIALTNTNILVGNAGGAAADVAMSGDATISNTGVVTVAVPKVKVLSQTGILASAFTDGGAAVGTFTMTGSIPAGAILMGSKVIVNAGFAGNVSAALEIGDGSDANRVNATTVDVFTTAATGVEAGTPSGNKLVTTAFQPVLTVTSSTDFTPVVTGGGNISVSIYYIATV